jgi:hypothetical protein
VRILSKPFTILFHVVVVFLFFVHCNRTLLSSDCSALFIKFNLFLLQKRNCWSLNKNSKGLLPPPKQEISTNQADLKKKKGHSAEGPPIALGAPNLEGPCGIFPTSLYGQSAPVHVHRFYISVKN